MGRNKPRPAAGSFLPAGRISFTTLATKDCILLTVQSDRCDAFVTTPNKPGGGATRRPVHPSASRIPARKSCSSQFQVNDSTQQTMTQKFLFTITVIAILP